MKNNNSGGGGKFKFFKTTNTKSSKLTTVGASIIENKVMHMDISNNNEQQHQISK